jgi:hypothetical protein
MSPVTAAATAPAAPEPIELLLSDPGEAAQWHLRSGIQAADPTAQGLRLEVTGPDPYLSRPLRLASGALGTLEIETAEPLAGRFQVFVRVGGVESLRTMLTTTPASPGSRVQVAHFDHINWRFSPGEEIRLDPSDLDRRLTLRRVTIRPIPRDDELEVGGEIRPCLRVPAVTARVEPAAAGTVIRFGVGVPPGLPDTVGHLDVRFRRPNGTTVVHTREAIALAQPGWRDVRVEVVDREPAVDVELAVGGAPEEALAGVCFEGPTAGIEGPQPATARWPNVVLVSLDTLRADALDDAPTLRGLAASGQSFANTWSAANWTLPAHAGLFTSTSWLAHQLPSFGALPPFANDHLRADQPLLAEAFAAGGYATMAATEGGFVASYYGFNRGFERFAAFPASVGDEGLASRARAVGFAQRSLDERGGRPFFLFFHTYVVHDYFQNTPAYQELTDDRDAALRASGGLGAWLGSPPPDPEGGEYLRRLYRGGVRRGDALLADVLAVARAAAGDEPLVVVVTSDHGESFGERGVWHHGTAMNAEQLRVPLVVWSQPPVPTPGTVDDRQVSSLDIAPSLLRRVGLPLPPAFRGQPDLFIGAPESTPDAALRLGFGESPGVIGDLPEGKGKEWGLHVAAWDGQLILARRDRVDGQTLATTCSPLAAVGGATAAPESPACQELARALARAATEDCQQCLVLRRATASPLTARVEGALAALSSVAAASAVLGEGRLDWRQDDADGSLVLFPRAGDLWLRELALGGVPLTAELSFEAAARTPSLVLASPGGGEQRLRIVARRVTSQPRVGSGPDAAAVAQLRALGYLQ